ncbi:Maf-like protein [Rickettsiales endosymbiont of Paramecium tredecaurelia]|uniref:Maf family protein n=1 Tax=Candidatus Sarmatiella mevalonica TaxID=2770581 RepID=UPI0019211932|nr:nucleoside triphosphate pyrophosphatase [Candidatus Sarmatiella mevalonica]MBL3284187.1 Maf-like protein [Candidatus Sarmatiella mevalonica]
MPTKTQIILASSSKTRIKLLHSICIEPNMIIAPELNETPMKHEQAHHLATRLAYAKSNKVFVQISTDSINCPEQAVIIAADTVACVGRKILPKAMNNSDVQNCLQLLSGKRHQVYTSLSVLKFVKCQDKVLILQKSHKTVKTIVKFKTLSKQEIERYLLLEQGIGKAGGYGIDGFAQSFVEFISGSFSNVLGLPLCSLTNILLSYGAY